LTLKHVNAAKVFRRSFRSRSCLGQASRKSRVPSAY
jgi:hypothetical protein